MLQREQIRGSPSLIHWGLLRDLISVELDIHTVYGRNVRQLSDSLNIRSYDIEASIRIRSVF